MIANKSQFMAVSLWLLHIYMVIKCINKWLNIWTDFFLFAIHRLPHVEQLKCNNLCLFATHSFLIHILLLLSIFKNILYCNNKQWNSQYLVWIVEYWTKYKCNTFYGRWNVWEYCENRRVTVLHGSAHTQLHLFFMHIFNGYKLNRYLICSVFSFSFYLAPFWKKLCAKYLCI